MSPTQHQARAYMGNSQPYTYWVESVILYIKSLCAQNKNCGIVVKTLQKNYIKWTTLNEVRKTKVKSVILLGYFGIMRGVVEEYGQRYTGMRS